MPNQAITVLVRVMEYLVMFLSLEDICNLAKTNSHIHDEVHKCSRIRNLERIFWYPPTIVAEQTTALCLASLDTINRLHLTPVMMCLQELMLHQLLRINTTLRRFSLTELAVMCTATRDRQTGDSIYKWIKDTFGDVTTLNYASDSLHLYYFKKDMLSKFVVPFINKNKETLRDLDVSFFSPWFSMYVKTATPDSFPNLRCLELTAPYCNCGVKPEYLWYGNDSWQRQASMQNKGRLYASPNPGLHKECCTTPTDQLDNLLFRCESCSPFGQDVKGRLRRTLRRLTKGTIPHNVAVAPNLEMIVIHACESKTPWACYSITKDDIIETQWGLPQGWSSTVVRHPVCPNTPEELVLHDMTLNVDNAPCPCLKPYEHETVAVIFHQRPLTSSERLWRTWALHNRWINPDLKQNLARDERPITYD